MKIALSGVVGAGKSTISKLLLQEYPNYLLLSEPVEENPYLDEYYENTLVMAFKMQIFMLMARTRQLKLAQNIKDVIFDRSILEDIIFVEVLKTLDLISEVDYQVYYDFYTNVVFDSIYLNNNLKPDVIIYLRINPLNAIERIKKRNRESEQLISYDYWKILNEKYEWWYETNKDKFNFLVIDVNNKNSLEIVGIIKEYLENNKL